MNELDYKKRIKQLEKYEKAHISMCQENERLRKLLSAIVNDSKPVFKDKASMENNSFPQLFVVGYQYITDTKSYLKFN